jgi:hypothetical protein
MISASCGVAIVRIMFGLFTLFIITACTRDTTITKPIAATAEQAIVVAGVRFGHARSENFTSASSVWYRYDPATGLVPRQKDDVLLLATYSCEKLDAAKGCGTNHYARFAHTIRPGHYVLSRVISRRRGSHSITEATNFVPYAADRHPRSDRPVEATGSPRFSIAAGEVIYLGDFLYIATIKKTTKSRAYGYDVPLYSYKLKRIEYDEPAAKAIADRFINGEVDVVVRPLLNQQLYAEIISREN